MSRGGRGRSLISLSRSSPIRSWLELSSQYFYHLSWKVEKFRQSSDRTVQYVIPHISSPLVALASYIIHNPHLFPARRSRLAHTMPSTLKSRVFIVGTGLIPMIRPRGLRDTPSMALEACSKAFLDAGMTMDAVEMAFAGYVYGDSCAGQRAIYQLGMTQIPIINVNNNCSTGSTALALARTMVGTGTVDVALALGFEQMSPGALSSNWTDRVSPLEPWMERMNEVADGPLTGPGNPNLFARAAEEYMRMHVGDATALAELDVAVGRIGELHNSR